MRARSRDAEKGAGVALVLVEATEVREPETIAIEGHKRGQPMRVTSDAEVHVVSFA